MAWTGSKVQQALLARREIRENLAKTASASATRSATVISFITLSAISCLYAKLESELNKKLYVSYLISRLYFSSLVPPK
jgi:hypothetical protein